MENSKKEILSINEEIELDREILEKIKGIKGIFYDEESCILTVTEELPENKFREILYWSRTHGREIFAITLLDLFENTHYENSFKKTHRDSKPDSISPLFIIEGGNVFSAGSGIGPRFFLEWHATFEVVNKEVALEHKFWNDLFWYEWTIEDAFGQLISKCIFEVYEKNRCSFIYETSAMLEKEKEELPNPFFADLRQILEEVKNALNNKFFNLMGLKIDELYELVFYPIQKPYLGLSEITRNTRLKAMAEVYSPIYAKIRKALEETKINKEKSRVQGNHIQISPDRKKETENQDEELELKLDEQGKPSVRINGKSITIEERFFVDIVYLAVCKLKRKDGWCLYKDELKWTPRHLKDYPSGIRNVLEKGIYKSTGDKGVLIETPAKTGKIRLGIFKATEDSIIIDKTIRNFNSEHRDNVNKILEDIKWDLDCKKKSGREIDDNSVLSAAERLGFDLDKIETTKLKPMIRHTYVIWKAVEEMGWEFHDDTWRKKWKNFLRRYEKIISRGELQKETRKELGFSWKF